MKRYRALEGTGGRGKARVVIQREGETLPQWVCDAGTLIEAEMIADALNTQGAVEALERIARGYDGQGRGTLLDSSRRLSRAGMMRIARDAIGGR